MDERWNSWLRHLLVAKLEPEPRPLPAGSLNLTSLSDSHAPAQPAAAPGPDWPQMGKPWPSSSQGPIKGSAPPPPPRAVTLFRKCRKASSTAGPRGVASFAGLPPGCPGHWRPYWGTGLCGLPRERGSGRSRGQRGHLLLVWLCVCVCGGIPRAHSWVCQGLLGGWGSNLSQAPSSQGLQNREHKQP